MFETENYGCTKIVKFPENQTFRIGLNVTSKMVTGYISTCMDVHAISYSRISEDEAIIKGICKTLSESLRIVSMNNLSNDALNRMRNLLNNILSGKDNPGEFTLPIGKLIFAHHVIESGYDEGAQIPLHVLSDEMLYANTIPYVSAIDSGLYKLTITDEDIEKMPSIRCYGAPSLVETAILVYDNLIENGYDVSTIDEKSFTQGTMYLFHKIMRIKEKKRFARPGRLWYDEKVVDAKDEFNASKK